MIDLIFIGIIAVFIAAMLWSDRDSRRVRIGETLRTYQKEAIENMCQAFRGLGVAMQAGDGKSALFHQAIGRAKRTKPYFIIDERFINKPESEEK